MEILMSVFPCEQNANTCTTQSSFPVAWNHPLRSVKTLKLDRGKGIHDLPKYSSANLSQSKRHLTTDNFATNSGKSNGDRRRDIFDLLYGCSCPQRIPNHFHSNCLCTLAENITWENLKALKSDQTQKRDLNLLKQNSASFPPSKSRLATENFAANWNRSICDRWRNIFDFPDGGLSLRLQSKHFQSNHLFRLFAIFLKENPETS